MKKLQQLACIKVLFLPDHLCFIFSFFARIWAVRLMCSRIALLACSNLVGEVLNCKRAAQILAKREKASIDDPAEVKDLCKQVSAVSTRKVGSPYNAINYRRQMFAGWAYFNAPCIFLL